MSVEHQGNPVWCNSITMHERTEIHKMTKPNELDPDLLCKVCSEPNRLPAYSFSPFCIIHHREFAHIWAICKNDSCWCQIPPREKYCSKHGGKDWVESKVNEQTKTTTNYVERGDDVY